MLRTAHKDHLVIGWQEFVALPEWGVTFIRAKSDTGARSTAVDVVSLEELPGNRVRFELALSRNNRDKLVQAEADISRRTRVRSAHGSTQDRLFVETTIRIGPIEKKIEVGLVCRKKMICRMLLGRTTLEGSFLVMSDERFLFGDREHHKQKSKSKKKKSKKTTRKLKKKDMK